MHRLLRRQLRKAGLDVDGLPDDPDAWRALLASVERSYEQIDDGRYLVEQSMDALSREMRSLYEDLDAARREQAALREVATASAARMDLPRLFDLVTERAAAIIAGGRVSVVRFEGYGSTELAASSATDAPPPDDGVEPLTVPIYVEGDAWGQLVATGLETEGGPRSHASLLQGMAELVSLAVGNAADRRRLAAQASTDSLTGLANHRAFQERLRTETARALRYGLPLSLMLIDLDRFKQVNDSLGHPEGDRVLVAMAQRLRVAARASDLVARVGGEEFALLLPETGSHETMVVAERLRGEVSSGPIGPVERLTISIGVCDLETAGGDPGELYGYADAALYRAKRAGRNMSMSWSANTPGA